MLTGSMATERDIKRDFRNTVAGIIQLVIAGGIIAVISLVSGLKTDLEVVKVKIESNIELKSRVTGLENRVITVESDLKTLTNEERLLHNKDKMKSPIK